MTGLAHRLGDGGNADLRASNTDRHIGKAMDCLAQYAFEAREPGLAGRAARAFRRRFFRSATNDGLAVVECDTRGIEPGDAVTIALERGRVLPPAREPVRDVPPRLAAGMAILPAGGPIPVLEAGPEWRGR